MGTKRLKSKEYEINACKFSLNFQFSIPNFSSYDSYHDRLFHILSYFGSFATFNSTFFDFTIPVLKFNLRKILNQAAYIKKNTCLVASRSLPVAFNPLNASVALI